MRKVSEKMYQSSNDHSIQLNKCSVKWNSLIKSLIYLSEVEENLIIDSDNNFYAYERK
jgi:hypothetical protein